MRQLSAGVNQPLRLYSAKGDKEGEGPNDAGKNKPAKPKTRARKAQATAQAKPITIDDLLQDGEYIEDSVFVSGLKDSSGRSTLEQEYYNVQTNELI